MNLEPDGDLARSSWELVCEKREGVISSSLKSHGTMWDSSSANLCMAAAMK